MFDKVCKLFVKEAPQHVHSLALQIYSRNYLGVHVFSLGGQR